MSFTPRCDSSPQSRATPERPPVSARLLRAHRARRWVTQGGRGGRGGGGGVHAAALALPASLGARRAGGRAAPVTPEGPLSVHSSGGIVAFHRREEGAGEWFTALHAKVGFGWVFVGPLERFRLIFILVRSVAPFGQHDCAPVPFLALVPSSVGTRANRASQSSRVLKELRSLSSQGKGRERKDLFMKTLLATSRVESALFARERVDSFISSRQPSYFTHEDWRSTKMTTKRRAPTPTPTPLLPLFCCLLIFLLSFVCV